MSGIHGSWSFRDGYWILARISFCWRQDFPLAWCDAFRGIGCTSGDSFRAAAFEQSPPHFDCSGESGNVGQVGAFDIELRGLRTGISGCVWRKLRLWHTFQCPWPDTGLKHGTASARMLDKWSGIAPHPG